MSLKNPNLILIFFITFLICSYVELNFGGYGSSGYIALFFFAISLLLLYRLINSKLTPSRFNASKNLILMGSALVIFDILYNFEKGTDIQTLDTAIIFLGLSLISINFRNMSLIKMGEFGIYFCSIFITLFLLGYSIPSKLGSNIYDYYGYYATTFPSVSLLRIMGISIDIDSLTTFHANGIGSIYYKIDLGCFGFYSILLIISTVFAYWLTLPEKNPQNLLKIVLILIFASFLSNILRIISIVYIGYYYGRPVMLFYHTFSGWITFVIIVLPVAYLYLRKLPYSD